MTEMLIRGSETPLHDVVLGEVRAAHALQSGTNAVDARELQDVRPQGASEATQTVAPATSPGNTVVDPDMRTWGVNFVSPTKTQIAEQPIADPEHGQEFDTSTLAGARKYLLAVVAGKYGMQGTVKPFRYVGNARALDERRNQSVFGRLGSDFRTQSF